VSPTARTAAALAAIALSALVLPPLASVLAALALAGGVLADALLARRRPRFTRRAPDLLSRGVADGIDVRAEVESPLAVEVRQAGSEDLEVSPTRGQSPLAASLVARRRGRHALPGAAARLTGPLGLAAWYRSSDEPHEVRVFPDLPAARRVALVARRSRFRDPGLRGRGPLGLGTEFESVREYSPDDDIRQVNWRATARLERPMSNEFRLEQDRDVIALVDCGRLMAAPIADRTRLDAALDALTALAAVTDEVGDRFGAIAFDAEIRTALRPRRNGGALAVNTLFDLEPAAVESDYARAFQRVESSKRALIVVFTDLLDDAAAGALIEAVPVLARRHAVAVASATDPDVETAIANAPRAELDVYRAAVGIQVLDARRRVAALLRRAGAELIEAPAEKLGAASVRTYLRAKARARL
jgi:uncharacterized protein (DUF58 family)